MGTKKRNQGFDPPPSGRWLTVRIVHREMFDFKNQYGEGIGVRFSMKVLDDDIYGCDNVGIRFFPHTANEATGRGDTIWMLQDFAGACGMSKGQFDNEYDWKNHNTLMHRELEVIASPREGSKFLSVHQPSYKRPSMERRHWRALTYPGEQRKYRNLPHKGSDNPANPGIEPIDHEKVLGIAPKDGAFSDWD